MVTKTFKRKADAEAWASEIEREFRLGHLVSREAERRTLADLIERYEREVLDERGGDSEDRRRQLHVWRERIGGRLLIHITPAVIVEERTRFRRTQPCGRVRFLEDDERGRLLEACAQSKDDRLHVLVVIALSTGMRQGELLGLRPA